MRIGSLFSGIGGLELGLERAGVGTTIWQVEQDEFCRRVLAKHWPDAVRFDDVRTVGSKNLAPVDLICGGFPCQDISYAGKGAGLAGERSGLWFEFARIVREMEPRFVVVENVAALLTRGLGDVLGSLAALGYDAVWLSLSASEVGARHIRERVFVVAYTNQAGPQEPWPSKQTAGDSGCGWEAAEGWWASESEIPRGCNGLPYWVDRIASLGNAVVPQCAEVVGWIVKELAEEEK